MRHNIIYYVCRTDDEYEAFMNHIATTHTTKVFAKYLFPIIKSSIDRYYKLDSTKQSHLNTSNVYIIRK